MSGNTANPRLWEGADLWTAPLGTALPTDLVTEMTTVPAWEAVGLLSEDGASESRDEDSSDFYAWGGKLVRVKRSKHKRTITVTCLEDNLVVFGLVNPGSEVTTVNGVNTRKIKIPKSEKVAFCLELQDGDITRRRFIPTGEVTNVGEVALSDSALQAFELTITIFPDADDVLYHDIDNDPQGNVPEVPAG
ncbi:phage tail tube protein [Streptomyces fungicidicus]|uniref:phage tail tube protein n=2 Tax=Streptomyces fungicidicus TaxID=68203 RepID=UPI00367D3DF4